MRELISLISTHGKSDEQIRKEVEESLVKDKATDSTKLPEGRLKKEEAQQNKGR